MIQWKIHTNFLLQSHVPSCWSARDTLHAFTFSFFWNFSFHSMKTSWIVKDSLYNYIFATEQKPRTMSLIKVHNGLKFFQLFMQRKISGWLFINSTDASTSKTCSAELSFKLLKSIISISSKANFESYKMKQLFFNDKSNLNPRLKF